MSLSNDAIKDPAATRGGRFALSCRVLLSHFMDLPCDHRRQTLATTHEHDDLVERAMRSAEKHLHVGGLSEHVAWHITLVTREFLHLLGAALVADPDAVWHDTPAHRDELCRFLAERMSAPRHGKRSYPHDNCRAWLNPEAWDIAAIGTEFPQATREEVLTILHRFARAQEAGLKESHRSIADALHPRNRHRTHHDGKRDTSKEHRRTSVG